MLLRDLPLKIFFLQPVSRKKEKNRVPTSYFQEEYEIRRWVFLSSDSLKSRKRRIFLPTSYIQGQVRKNQGSRWVRQGWSIATRRGREKVMKRKRPRKAGLSPQEGDVRKSWKEKDQGRLVYRHKKGTWETQEKEKKRKRPRKVRRWLQRRQGSVSPTPRIPFFWFTSIWA